MAERSRPWSGIVPGDSGPYSDDQWTDVWKQFAPTIAREGVFQGQLNELDLSSVAATPVSVASGRALVNGIWYETDASRSLAIANATAGNLRVDRIVARASWAAQTVRLLVVQGANVAANPVPPALVQVDGTTWDLPLWQVQATDAGVLTFFRDERAFIGNYEPGAPTDDFTYLDNEMFMGDSNGVISSTQEGILWGVDISGSYTATSLNTIGSGAITFNAAGAGAGHVFYHCGDHRPDLINGHQTIRAKVPNTDANLDKVMGIVTDFTDSTPLDGVFFRAIGAGNWFAVCRNSNVESAVDTTIAQSDVWRKFEMRQHGSDVVTFLIDDVVRATIQTNIPTTGSKSFATGIVDSGANPVDVAYLDVDRMKLTGSRPA